MNREAGKKWVEALRSGEYEKSTLRLESPEGFCCLGILCKLAEKEDVPVTTTINGKLAGHTLSHQHQVKEWSGISSDSGDLEDDRRLTHLNDEGSSFEELADIIEKEIETL